MLPQCYANCFKKKCGCSFLRALEFNSAIGFVVLAFKSQQKSQAMAKKRENAKVKKKGTNELIYKTELQM